MSCAVVCEVSRPDATVSIVSDADTPVVTISAGSEPEEVLLQPAGFLREFAPRGLLQQWAGVEAADVPAAENIRQLDELRVGHVLELARDPGEYLRVPRVSVPTLSLHLGLHQLLFPEAIEVPAWQLLPRSTTGTGQTCPCQTSLHRSGSCMDHERQSPTI